jgi:hypothetical protein
MINTIPGFNASTSLRENHSNYLELYSRNKIENIIPSQLQRGRGGLGVTITHECKEHCINCQLDVTTGLMKCGEPYCCKGTIIISW